MRFLSRLSFVALAALLLGSCQKNPAYVGTPSVQPVLPDPVTTTVQGNIFDENNQPASGVTITVGNRTVLTDTRGFFRITGASLDKNTSLVKAEKSGYFKAYRSFAATSGANMVQIKLLRRTLTGTVNGATGGDATLSNGARVTLPANGIVVAASGAAYTGPVSVFAAYIDPTTPDIAQTIPGSLIANDRDGRRVSLTSFGMLAVELQGSNGEKLQIKSGSTARLSAPIPQSAQAAAPATIPMWYVDEATGVWKEQGSATRQGNTYVGDVPHFSFWNYDISVPSVNLTVTLKTTSGAPLTHALVRLTRPGNMAFSSSYGWTDSLGQVTGLVPANEQLQLQVLDRCYNAVYGQQVGPFAQNTTLPAITATLPNAQLTNLTGRLLNCSGGAVTNGFAIISLSNVVRYASVDASGNFSVQLLNCIGGGSIEIVGVDNSNQVQSTLTTVSFAPGTTNAGNISVCGVSATQFINYTVDGTNYTVNSNSTQDSLAAYVSPVQGTTSYSTYIMGASGNNIITFNFQGPAGTGTFAANGLYINGQQTANNNITVTVTSWPAQLGQFMEGTFTGTYVTGGTTRNLSGNFKLRRM